MKACRAMACTTRLSPENKGVVVSMFFGAIKKFHVRILPVIVSQENQGKYMIMVLVVDSALCLLGYSNRRKMHAVFKLSLFF